MPDKPLMAAFDRRLLTQAVTNLVKNATEAVETAAEAEPGRPCRVDIVLRTDENTVAIDIIDNGPGLPKQNRSRLLEPYVTTKGHKGTGLGLAIDPKSLRAACLVFCRCAGSHGRLRFPVAA